MVKIFITKSKMNEKLKTSIHWKDRKTKLNCLRVQGGSSAAAGEIQVGY